MNTRTDHYEDPRDPHWYSEPAVTVREMTLAHEKAIRALEAWRDELTGAFQLVKLALGASVISAIVSILALMQWISRSL